MWMLPLYLHVNQKSKDDDDDDDSHSGFPTGTILATFVFLICK